MRFVNVDRNVAHGLFTLDMGDRFLQRDLQVTERVGLVNEWYTYTAYPRYSYYNEVLYLVIDRVQVNNLCDLEERENIFHGLAVTDYNQKNYQSVRIHMDEVHNLGAVCAQGTTEDAATGELSSKTLMFFIELTDPDGNGLRNVQLKILDSPNDGIHECAAASLNEETKKAYFLLDDSLSHITELYTFDFDTNRIFDFSERTMPYSFSHAGHQYTATRALLFEDAHFAMVNIDTKLYGVDMTNGYDVGYIIDSRDRRRVNSYMSTDYTELFPDADITFTATPYPRSFLRLDTVLEAQTNPVSS